MVGDLKVWHLCFGKRGAWRVTRDMNIKCREYNVENPIIFGPVRLNWGLSSKSRVFRNRTSWEPETQP